MKIGVLKSLIVFLILISTMAVAVSATSPSAASVVTNGTDNTKPTEAALNVTANGGNITEVGLDGQTQTTVWQGFFGQVTGNITLRDDQFSQLYSWTVSAPTGEVIASQNNSIDFSTFDTHTVCVVDESITGTGTDSVSSTFTNNTIALEIGSSTFTEGCNTSTYTSNVSQSSVFPEYIGNATDVSSIYVTAINDSTTGYNGSTIDYQMIVPAAVSGTTYSFFVEFD